LKVENREERSFTTEDTESTEKARKGETQEVESSKLKVKREKADPSAAKCAASGRQDWNSSPVSR
jgi:hypothetical protein